MYGGDGGDAFFEYESGNGDDAFHGGAGDDLVIYGRTEDVIVSTDGVTNDGASACLPVCERDNVMLDVEGAFGGEGDDVLDGGSAGQGVRLAGMDGDDLIIGTNFDDDLDGGGDGDLILGLAGPDRLYSGRWARLNAPGVYDGVYGGGGDDTIGTVDGSPGDARVYADSGIDTCLVDAGDPVQDCEVIR